MVFYVTRDIERALGAPTLPDFFIISNATPFAKEIATVQNNILLIEKGHLLDTRELLQEEAVAEYIATKTTDPKIVVFKNTPFIERICTDRGWRLVNPSASLADTIEEKISQVAWLGELGRYLPPHSITACEEVTWDHEPFILQFNRAHTGSGTTCIESEKQLQEVQQQFPHRPVRITRYIHGPMLTNNNIVTQDHVIVGSINYQITGLAPFTDSRFATVGNDWGVISRLLTSEQQTGYKKMAQDIGERLRQDGWRGAFGIDVALESETGQLYLIEVNARQPASLSYESFLQGERQKNSFELHIEALLEKNIEQKDSVRVDSGAQIVLRQPKSGEPWDVKKVEAIEDALRAKGLKTVRYSNTKPGSDLLRIQSLQSIMKTHNELSNVGELILQCI